MPWWAALILNPRGQTNQQSEGETDKITAACPGGSLEHPFIRDLNRTSGVILKNGGSFLI